MPILFRLLLAIAPLLLLGPSACKGPFCPPLSQEVWVGSAYLESSSWGGYRERANVWIDNPKMVTTLNAIVEKQGRRALVYRHDFECSPQPREGCAECMLCTLSTRDIAGFDCKPAGNFFVRAEVGADGKVTAAQTYWQQ